MAIKVNNVTVIGDTRQLSNVASIDSVTKTTILGGIQADLEVAVADAVATEIAPIEGRVEGLEQFESDVSSQSGSSFVGFRQDGIGAVVRTAQDKLREWVSVTDFGAVGDGVADDTAAIQSAINYAQTQSGADYWHTYFRAVYFPPGVYLHSGLSIDKPVKLFGDGPIACSLSLKTASNTHAISVLAPPNSVATNDSFRQHATISGMTINCNGSGQSGTCHGVYLPDSHNLLTTRYDGAVVMSDVVIRAAKDSNIFVGVNRNNGAMERVSSLYAGADGITANGYDWRIDACDFGNNGGAGMRFNSGGAHSVYGTYSYMNGDAGVVISAAVNAGCMFDGCYIDTNQTHGAYIEGQSLDNVCHSINNSVFRDNGTRTYNTYAHVFVKNIKLCLLDSNQFVVNTTSVRAAYVVFTDNAAAVRLTGLADIINATTKPFATAAVNDASKMVSDDYLWDGWSTYTPVVSAGAGAITAASATGKYRKRGKVVYWQAVVTITTNGTGASWVGISLPFQVGGSGGQSHFGVGRNATTGGALLVEFPAGSFVAAVRKFDDAYPGADSTMLAVSGTYQSAV